MNESLENALYHTVDELVADVTPEQLGDILNLCKILKYEHLICQLSTTRIQADIWDRFRKDKALMAIVFTATTVFTLKQADELETNIERLADNLVTAKNSSVVDTDFLDGIIPSKEAFHLLSENHWLYWLVTLTLNLGYLIKQFDTVVVKK